MVIVGVIGVGKSILVKLFLWINEVIVGMISYFGIDICLLF